MGKETRPIAVSGDWHIGGGFDRRKFGKFLEKVKDADVSECILNGDIIDSASCGKYVTKPGDMLEVFEVEERERTL